MSFPSSTEGAATGLSGVHPTNPRYFTDGAGKAIYLTGAHERNNFQVSSQPGNLSTFDYNNFCVYLTKISVIYSPLGVGEWWLDSSLYPVWSWNGERIKHKVRQNFPATIRYIEVYAEEARGQEEFFVTISKPGHYASSAIDR
jgi:hypothetical protein